MLRALLRQDPDVILLGEVRDPETALETAIGILDTAEDRWTREQATWLAAVASVRGPQPPEPLPDNASSLGLWNTLIEEEVAISQLKKRLTTPPDEFEEEQEEAEEAPEETEAPEENAPNSGDQG